MSNGVLDHLDVEQRRQLSTLLVEFRDVFDDVPGKTTLVEHQIQLKPGSKSVRQVPYRLHPEKLRMVNQEIDELLKLGIIEESDSPWAAPILVVPKQDGTGRLCTDFRKLNALTVEDPFPMPRVDALLDRLGGARFLTKLDMTRGYWQVPIESSSVPYTGFVTPQGHYQWRYMSFGLRNAPATFSKLVRKLFQGLESFCEAYLDDVLIFSKNWEDHVSQMKQVLQRIAEAHLKLNLKKCVFANAELDFLGHHVSLNAIQPRAQKVEALLNFPQPTNKKQMQSF